jgi:hypothetical protein
MPEKAIADLEEMSDPRYDGIPGSNLDDCRIEQDDMIMHNENWQMVLDQEYEENKALCGMV